MNTPDMMWRLISVIFLIWIQSVAGQEEIFIDEPTEALLAEFDKEVTSNATNKYDVIINDRDTNDVIVNEDNTEAPTNDLEEDDDEEEDDISKLLAAQVHAIEVFNMIKDLETEMKVKH